MAWRRTGKYAALGVGAGVCVCVWGGGGGGGVMSKNISASITHIK